MKFPTNPDEASFPVPDDCPSWGLTKREYFAALALQGLLANGAITSEATEWAVYAADYLIEALNDNPGEQEEVNA